MNDFNFFHGHKALLAWDDDSDFGITGDDGGVIDLHAADAPAMSPIHMELTTPASSASVTAASGAYGVVSASQTFSASLAISSIQTSDPDPEIQVNTYTTSNQSNPRVAVDADGDFVVVWSSNGQDGANYGIFGQRYNAVGVAQGSEFQINTYTTSSQNNPDVAMDDNGNFVVIWDSSGQDGNLLGIYGQRFNASGVAQGSEFRVNTYTTNSQGFGRVSMDHDGDFVITWGSNGQDGSGYGIFGQRYNAAGVAQGGEFQINTYTTGLQGASSVATIDSGFVVVWSSNGEDGSGNGVYGQRYDASGVAQGSEFRVNTYTTNAQANTNIAMDDNGNFVVVWNSTGQDGSNDGIYGQRFNASGVAQGSEFQVNTYTTSLQKFSTVAMDDDGDFVVTWQSYGQDGSSYGVFGQYYNGSGEAVGTEFQLNTYTSNFEGRPSVRMDGQGNFVVAWHTTNRVASNDVYVRVMPAPSVGPSLNSLDGDSTALAATGQFTALDNGTAATVTSSTLGSADWDGATLTVQRVHGNAADGGPNDQYSFLTSTLFTVDATGASFGGITAGTIAYSLTNHVDVTGVLVATADGLAFARYYYTYATGLLTIEFGDTGAGDPSLTGAPSKALVEDVLAHIGYGNSLPYGDAVIRFTLNDTGSDVTADVTVTSSTIHVDRTDSDTDGDAADGFSLREALARSVTQTGGDTVTLASLASDSTLTLSGTAATLGAGDTLSASASMTLAANGGGALALAGTATINAGTGVNLTVSAPLTGSSTLTKSGAGTLTLGGSNSGMSGGLSVLAGTVEVAGDGNLTGGLVSLATATTLQVTGATTIDNAISISGTATIETDDDVTSSGLLVGTSVIKTGAGRLTLTYSGSTLDNGLTVNAGALQVDALLSADITVSGAGAALFGNGTLGGDAIGGLMAGAAVGGQVTVQAGGLISAGAGGAADDGMGIGQLTINGGLTLAAAASLFAVLDGTTAGTGYDQIVVNGTVDVTDAVLSVDFTTAEPNAGDTFTLIDNDGSDAIVGTFDGLSQGAILHQDNSYFRISYAGGTGNDLTLTAINPVPEFTSGTTGSLAEGATGTAYQATATAITSDTIVWSLSGDDSTLFAIDDDTGAVTFLTAPDFENPSDTGANNVYNIIVTATTGAFHSDQAVAITVTDVSETLIGTEDADDLTATGVVRRVEGLGGNDSLTGSAGDDNLFGGAGADSLNGSTGTDTLTGGADSDIYYLDNGVDTVVELDGGGDADDVVLTGAAASYTLTAFVENLNVSATVNGTYTGNDLDNIIVTQNSAVATVKGGLGDDTYRLGDALDVVVERDNEGTDTVEAAFTYTLTAYVERLVLTGSDDVDGNGNGLGNRITGNSGANKLDGRAGYDTLYGGDGDDIYIVDSTGDVVSEETTVGVDDGGTDSVLATVGFTLADHIENLRLLGTDDIDGTGNDHGNTIFGNSGDNVLDGGSDADILSGGLGDDTYYVDNAGDRVQERADAGHDLVHATVNYTLRGEIEDLVLDGTDNLGGNGNDLDNVLTGNDGNNKLNGRAGDDTLYGGDGDDTYYVDSVSDTVFEDDNHGTDQVMASVGYTLSAHVENLTLTGTDDIDATGNGLKNTIFGNSGGNVLDGGSDADTLAGGLGDDTYYVDNAGDRVQEKADAGQDLVHASISYTLLSRVEDLVLDGADNLNGTGNELHNALTGNDGNNRLDGRAGNDSLYGGDGNDTYYVDSVGDVLHEDGDNGVDQVLAGVDYTLSANIENLTLTGTGDIDATGNDLANTIVGNSGDNVLDGGTGADLLSGGLGDDTYYVDNAGDRILERADAGQDLVHASVSYTLRAQIEDLVLDGTDNLSANGNELGNVLTGNDGNNKLDGRAGNDSLYGGAGNDTYYVNSIGDVLHEDADHGTDQVMASVDYTLSANIENLALTGTGDIDATGNGLANTIVGNSGDNVLRGGAGDDRLTGNGGSDSFCFEAAGVANGKDRVYDFTSGIDRLVFGADDYGFTIGHSLIAEELTVGNTAVGSAAQFVFVTGTSTLYWDADGDGSGAAVAIALLSGVTTLSASDFLFQ